MFITNLDSETTIIQKLQKVDAKYPGPDSSKFSQKIISKLLSISIF